MNKILIIGCPGAGKSTFAKQLQSILDIPLYHLDLLWHNADRTTSTRENFDAKLQTILSHDIWIIDGNYGRTFEWRIQVCDTIIFLDYPVTLCLQGMKNRIGKARDDMPWIEQNFDEEFKQYILNFPTNQLPLIESLLDKYEDTKTIYRFHQREEADRFLEKISNV